ncbi:MarR family winged helix-turn-helix transcriptional regulator [Parvularcula maris]|uniref:MarR family transcriptional regulator n=1 Tax=Parvularcula maris TaxID=2965077 RepID=A0A9X2L9U0_9PROT|nr:MarR family transcriptional regulator [Parvularcula maris]MCQ8185768.1 MarR family transcriptional regulator [Parvularcula maris]
MAKYELKESPGHLLRRAQQYADDLYKKEVGTGGLTARQFTVLHAISEQEGLSQTDLVRKTGIDRSTLADMIARLGKKGYVARQRTKDDARANAVKLSASGKKVLSSHEGKVMKAEAAALDALPKTQQSSFMKSLKAYADALEKIEAEEMAPKRQPAAKKAAKKAPAKKAAKKTAAKKTAAKKAPAKKTAAKKAPAKKAARKAPRKKAAKK